MLLGKRVVGERLDDRFLDFLGRGAQLHRLELLNDACSCLPCDVPVLRRVDRLSIRATSRTFWRGTTLNTLR